MGLRLANVLWKKDGHGILVMAGGNIYRINGEGAGIWLAIDEGGHVGEDDGTKAFMTELKEMGLLEEET
jgi:hypothetical protein